MKGWGCGLDKLAVLGDERTHTRAERLGPHVDVSLLRLEQKGLDQLQLVRDKCTARHGDIRSSRDGHS